ncbi:peptidoglycan recognition protein family protein [Streptomyces aureus]|uniref:peptidoglycan recognition protein family protein n=1 Tax=Streptomyces aureus TaxID=193461 RepID=UPI000565B7FC|nr:peptidoglycan recognition protein [Streptomyces aureus]
MRGFLGSSVGVTCAAALALPLTLPATPARADSSTMTSEAAAPGSTQSLPLAPLTRRRGSLGPSTQTQGLARRNVRPFSLVGVIWDDPDSELNGRVQVRTRAAGTGDWSDWQDVETHNDEHAADPDTAESASRRVHGSTAPLWVGNSNGVEVRVQAEPAEREAADPLDEAAPEGPRERRATLPEAAALPGGLRLELVDPGGDPPAPDGTRAAGRAGGAPSGLRAKGVRAKAVHAKGAQASLPDAGGAKATVIPALSRAETLRTYFPDGTSQRRATPYIGPRPSIVTRHGWGANENLRERGFLYTKTVKAAFVHHTASGNKYSCSQVPSIIRSIYRYHVVSSGWRDIGYNFLVDKCGTIYEGRAGGVAKAVMGAHTRGFNTNSMGIAVIGSFGATKPTDAALKAISRLTAWKLGLYGADPRGKTYLKSAGGNLYRKGKNVRLNVISGHRDGFATECPGRLLYGKLGTARTTAAKYQGR